MTSRASRMLDTFLKWFLIGLIAGLLLKVFVADADAQELGAATLSWSVPTQNEDGTPLTDLKGYKIFYGTMPPDYPNEIDVSNPATTVYVVENLAPGDYHFVMTAYNEAGTQSGLSNGATKTIPPPPGPLLVFEDIVYTVVKQTDEFVLIPVGTIAVGTPCDETQAVNDHNVVPADQMTPFGSVVPLVVVAKCER